MPKVAEARPSRYCCINDNYSNDGIDFRGLFWEYAAVPMVPVLIATGIGSVLFLAVTLYVAYLAAGWRDD